MYDPADYLLISLILFYLLIAPYTKVEESFNIQAIHDLLFYGSDISAYDHIDFPGVVPRTFVGALIVAVLTKPIQLLTAVHSKFNLQIAARGLIGLANALGLISFKSAVVRSVQDPTSKHIIKWTMSGFLIQQFHLLFYASRPLPNFLVLPIVLFALAKLFGGSKSVGTGIALLSFSSVVFRSELAVFTGTIALTFFAGRKVSLVRVIFNGLAGVAVGAAVSLAVDGYFWGNLEIPEIKAFIFNVIEGNANQWGTDPYPVYFVVHLQNILNNRLLFPMALAGLVFDKTSSKSHIRLLGISSILYVAILSFQPHKEWRFIVYVVPPLIAAASGFLATINQVHEVAYILFLQGVGLVSILGTGLTIVKVWGSSYNYSGGVALSEFHKLAFPSGYPSTDSFTSPVVVHMDVPVCMTGATRFGQVYDAAAESLYPNLQPVIYDKVETEDELSANWYSYDYLITVANSEVREITVESGYCWEKIKTIPNYNGINFQHAMGIFRTLKDDPDVYLRGFALSENKKQYLKGIFAPIIVLKDTVFIYQKKPAGQCAI